MGVSTVLVVLGAAILLLVAASVLRFRATTRAGLPFAPGARAVPVATDVPVEGGAPPLDVYAPAADGAKRPVVVLVPGEGPDWLMRGARKMAIFRSYADVAAAHGLAAAVAGHRSSRWFADCARATNDVRAALRTLAGRADALGIDAERMVVWCFSGSAGPVLADLVHEPVAGVRGGVSFYGVLDPTTWSKKVPAQTAERWSLPRALERAQTLPFPLYLLAAGRDRPPMREGFERARKALEGRALPVETRVYDGPHAFEIGSPPDEVREEVNRGFAFVARALGAAQRESA